MTDKIRISTPTPDWYDKKRAEEVLEAYNKGGGSALPSDDFVAHSVVPAGTGAFRDFSYIAPEVPEYSQANCVACMECVQNCPDTAILGKVVKREDHDALLSKISNPEEKELVSAQFAKTVKIWDTYEKKHVADPSAPPGAYFGIFVDVTKCKGCGECVEVCGDHKALKMIKKTPDNLPDYQNLWKIHNELPATPKEYINPKLAVDIMLKPQSLLYKGGAGSCMGCGEASVIRQVLAATSELVGNNFGVVAATGCNTVYSSTYPYNPFMVPWTNSLFENAPTDAMGVRAFWDETGHQDRVLWVFGGDGAMNDIGFQALSRMLVSGMNIKVLVLDTQVYSNTGGQASTATFIGQEAKMSVHGKVIQGKMERRKELAQIAMMHPNSFVAQTVGPMINHFYRAVQRAIEYKGPALINVYTTCQPEHGVADNMSAAQARMAVESRAFPLMVYDPEKGRTIRERISLQGNPSVTKDWHVIKHKDGREETFDFVSWAKTEGRFRKHFDKNENPSAVLLQSKQERLDNWWLLQDLAGIKNIDHPEGK